MRYLPKSFRRHFGWLIIMSYLLLSACGVNGSQATTQKTTVPQIFVNSLNISTNKADLYITALHGSDGKISWQHQAQWVPGFHSMGAPVVVDGLLYAPSDSYDLNATHLPTGFLSAFRVSDGQRLWQANVGALGSPPVVHDGIVYLSAVEYAAKSSKKWIYALNEQNGKQIWRTENVGANGSDDTLTFANGNLYISSNQICFDVCTATDLFSLNATTGTLRWYKTFQATSSSKITIDDNNAYVYIADESSSTSGQGLYALNTDTGETLWSVAYAVPLIGSFSNPDEIRDRTIQVIDGVIYAKTTVGADHSSNPDTYTYTLTALDARNGRVIWSIPTTAASTILAADAHTLYVQTEKANRDLTKPPTGPAKNTSASSPPYTYFLSAISMHNGQSLWQHLLVSRFEESQVVAGTLYSEASGLNPTQSFSLVAINTTNGDTTWQATIVTAGNSNDRSYSVFTVAQNILYTIINANTLAAVSLKDGKILWQTKISQATIVSISIA